MSDPYVQWDLMGRFPVDSATDYARYMETSTQRSFPKRGISRDGTSKTGLLSKRSGTIAEEAKWPCLDQCCHSQLAHDAPRLFILRTTL